MRSCGAADDSRLGSLNIVPVICPPTLPKIVAEWASVIPLVIHLATNRNDYITTGEVALLGRISLEIFPKLGALSSLARLLQCGPGFLDQASIRGGESRTVWDVRWGSVFPAANGAASIAIIDYVLSRTQKTPVKMPDKVPTTAEAKQEAPSELAETNNQNIRAPAKVTNPRLRPVLPDQQPSIVGPSRRYQTLHILYFRKGPQPRPTIFSLNWFVVASHIMTFLILVNVAIILSIGGLFGSAAILFFGAVSRVVSPGISIDRPPGYLVNNENHDACMLLASHPNAMEWYLNIGDRSIVDTLLNKPMLQIIADSRTMLIGHWLNIANTIQLAAVTFVAAQKGWDGVSLIVLMAIDGAVRWRFRGRNLARNWLEREGVEVVYKTFLFTSRSSMIGAIQLYSKTKVTNWIDSIMTPHPRRDAWLRSLLGEQWEGSLNNADREWVKLQRDLSCIGARLVSKELEAEIV
ncbi:hypothetical protein EPUS_07172 [Endocarpon pusillum Z07020]|uniref:Uncharacterized protein n=1 Tax=Endocarpon pusillum (strain Z07020 / HMAS-L-300199) TaxID=1263415 RepID=U1GAA9_ENDPU|nr:uncharacterized protein EPUS_07172 [Endocarpon pusillum Z07020]ERF68611.1 hypothetical protein EPUS_07172 [Endocarpon pusillum Z07020]